MIKKTIIFFIKFYHNYLAILMLPTCRFYPSCSCYAIESIEKYGALKGLVKSGLRVLKCNPFHKGGFDPA